MARPTWSRDWPRAYAHNRQWDAAAGAPVVHEVFGEFPFLQWAAANGFAYPPDAAAFLCLCESPAEASLVREFVSRPGVTFTSTTATCGEDRLMLQKRAWHHRIDAVVARHGFELAIEVDGLAFHAANQSQLAKDYLRQRRLVCAGYATIRFTAQETLRNPAACWRQIDKILYRRASPLASALPHALEQESRIDTQSGGQLIEHVEVNPRRLALLKTNNGGSAH